MNYRECLRYLEQIQRQGMKFGLNNVRAVLQELHNPHHGVPFIQVAGSNGKGSVSAMLSRIFTLNGWRCGLFTSPHLMHVQERIRINGDPVSTEDFCMIMTELRNTVDDMVERGVLEHPPTYFEMMTLGALLYFKRRRVDAAVLEVGMGGRFDATSVVDPEVTVITTISLEHEKYLGDTSALIAAEKAAVIKTGTPVVSGVLNEEAREIIRKRAGEDAAPFMDVFAPESRFRSYNDNPPSYSFQWNGQFFLFTPSLPGRHQGRNAAVAVAAALEMGRRREPLSRDSIIRGVETTCWEGRLEIIRRHPTVILDGAHNEEGASALRDYIKENFADPVVMVFAVMKDKNISRVGEILFPSAERIILTTFNYHRAASPEDILQALPAFRGRAECEPHPGKAVQTALAAAGKQGVVVAAGSLYLIGAIKNIFRRLQAAGKAC
ncbi:MAG: folylpolyglutamate synthase/dihydrofolate synthase family protein [Candidatus Aminicenantes bacterium]